MFASRFCTISLWVLLALAGLAQEADWTAARKALDRGRPDQALAQLTQSDARSQVLRLEAYCELDEYTQARDVLARLEGLVHSDFPPPYDFRFYLYRGRFQQVAGEFALARKNYSEARRRASRLEQRLEVQMREVKLCLAEEQLEKAEKEFARTADQISECQDLRLLLSHLELSARLQSKRGNRPIAMACNRAARELCLVNSLTSLAADQLIYRLKYLPSEGQEAKMAVIERATAEYLSCKNYDRLILCLDELQFLYFSLAGSGGEARIRHLFERTLAALPAGLAKDKALLSWANYRLDTGVDPDGLRELYEQLGQSSSAEIRCQAHMGVALWFGEQGDRARSLEEFEKALKLTSPQMRRDRQWRNAPGAIRLRMAYQEKARHRLEEALKLGREGIALQPGKDWTFWRVEARYETLMSAVKAFDVEAAEAEFQASLADIERLPGLREKVGAFTTILASLLLNQSVEGDVLDPSVPLLGEYSEIAVHLLESQFGQSGTTDVYLSLFDQWHAELSQVDDPAMRSYPLIYKGLFLEALGRLAEARVALDSGLNGGAKESQILARTLLARVNVLQGDLEAAAEHTHKAAEISLTLNPLAGRFYSLVAGGAHRRAGQYEQALKLFDQAITLKPERGWPGFYGRALTFEAMGQDGMALMETNKALELVSESERLHSMAQIRALKARLLARLGRSQEAVEDFASAHAVLLSSPLCARVTLDYGALVESQGEDARALELYVNTLDHLAQAYPSIEPELRSLFETTVTLALKLGKNATALKYLSLSRSVELIDSVDLSRVQAEDQETRALLPELKKLRLRLSRLQQESGEASSRQAREMIGQQLAATRGEFMAKLNQLREREPDFESLVQVSGSQLSAIQELLPARTALVEYFPASSTLYVFVVSADSFSLHQVSLPRKDLEEKSQRLLLLCTAPGESTSEVSEVSRFLHGALIEVAQEKLNGVDHLLIVPSGPLWEVPFSTLLDFQGRPLRERYRLSYLGSSEILKLLRTRPTSTHPSALLVGGTDKLRGVEREISALSAMLPGARVLGASQATVEKFRQALKGRSLVHIASHSFVSRQSGETYVEIGKERMTLDQIYGFKLEPSSMVVLSSCRSGVGVTVPGKEVTSLATAFSVAGASSVLASRWQVDDNSTAEFFRYFYSALLSGKSRAESLQAAQALMAREQPHPYYWAAFHLLGSVE